MNIKTSENTDFYRTTVTITQKLYSNNSYVETSAKFSLVKAKILLYQSIKKQKREYIGLYSKYSL